LHRHGGSTRLRQPALRASVRVTDARTIPRSARDAQIPAMHVARNLSTLAIGGQPTEDLMDRRLFLFAAALPLLPLPLQSQTNAPPLRLRASGVQIAVSSAGPGRVRLDVTGPDGRETLTGSFDPAAAARVADAIRGQSFRLETDEGLLTVSVSRGRLRIEGGGQPPIEIAADGVEPNLIHTVGFLVGVALGALFVHVFVRLRIPRPRPRRRARLLPAPGGVAAQLELTDAN
jgi:hypothetical protein